MLDVSIDVDRLKLAVQMARNKSTLASLDTTIQVTVEPEGLRFRGRHRDREHSRYVDWIEVAYAHESVLKQLYTTHINAIIESLTP